MTFADFQGRIDSAIDDAVETLTNIPPIGRPAWLTRFERRMCDRWGQVFARFLEPEEVVSLVVGIVETIQARLAELEGGATVTTIH
jgi:hypothetical protein